MNTMEILEAIQQRRSINHFDPTCQMTDAEIEQLLNLAILSPTAFNIQNWRFVVVKDPELRKQVRDVADNQAQVTDAALLIILCADLKAWEKEPGRYWRNAPPPVQEILLSLMDGFYRDKPQIERDEAMRSCGIASQTLMLAAKGMGYDTCALVGFDFEKVAKLINLPEDHVIGLFVAVGKPLKQAPPKPGQLALSDVMMTNTF